MSTWLAVARANCPLVTSSSQAQESFLYLQSTYTALKEQVNAKAEIKGNLYTYKYFDNVSGGVENARTQQVYSSSVHVVKARQLWKQLCSCWSVEAFELYAYKGAHPLPVLPQEAWPGSSN